MRRVFRYGRLGVGVLALACTAPVAAAQTVNPETVPLEFMQLFSVITPFPTEGMPEIIVGGLPAIVARNLQLPADTRIVGSVVRTGFTSSILVMPGPLNVAVEDLSTRILAAGWREYEEPSRVGFQSALTGGITFCAPDSTTLSMGGFENPQGGSYLFLIALSNQEYSVCRYEPRRSALQEDPPVPELTAPESAMSYESGYSGGGDAWNFRTRLQTELPLDRLLEHYGVQLRGLGWVPKKRTAADDVVVEILRYTDTDGREWSGILTSTALPGESDRFIISFNATRLSGSH